MIQFNLWFEALIFSAIYSTIVIVPCVIVTMIGLRMIDKLGCYPTKTPVIQMKVLLPLIMTEILTFTALWWFLNFFYIKKE